MGKTGVTQHEVYTLNTNLVGKWLEICWPYKLDGKTIKIWSSGMLGEADR